MTDRVDVHRAAGDRRAAADASGQLVGDGRVARGKREDDVDALLLGGRLLQEPHGDVEPPHAAHEAEGRLDRLEAGRSGPQRDPLLDRARHTFKDDPVGGRRAREDQRAGACAVPRRVGDLGAGTRARRRLERSAVEVADDLPEAERACRVDEVVPELEVDDPQRVAALGVELDAVVLVLEWPRLDRGLAAPPVDELEAAVAERRHVTGDEREQPALRPVPTRLRHAERVRHPLAALDVDDRKSAGAVDTPRRHEELDQVGARAAARIEDEDRLEQGRPEAGAGRLAQRLRAIPCLDGERSLGLPLQLGRLATRERAAGGVGGAPGVLVEQRHALVDAIGFAGPVEVRVGAGEGVGHDVQRLCRPYRRLGTAVEADLARGRAEAVGPPVGPVAAERLELGAVPSSSRSKKARFVDGTSCG